MRVRKKISIGIGEYHASRSPCVLQTVLGSCVAVCLFDPTTRVGGMNHIFLPGKADMECYNKPARYGVNAMELLINKMMRLGMNKKAMVAKVFGGGHLFPSIPYENGIGRKIENFVSRFLENERIPVISHDLGGVLGRKVAFYTDTGDAFVKRTVRLKNKNIFKREENALKHVRRTVERPDSIILFE